MTLETQKEQMIEALKRFLKLNQLDALTRLWQGEPQVLRYLYTHQEEVVNPSALSDSLQVTRARVTSVLTVLRKKGLIEMRVSEKDRRRMVVMLSEQGRTMVEREFYAAQERIARLCAGLGEENVKQMLRLLTLSADILEETREDAGK